MITSHIAVETKKGYLSFQKTGDEGYPRNLEVSLLNSAPRLADLSIVSKSKRDISRLLTGAEALTDGVFLEISTAFPSPLTKTYAVRFGKGGNASVVVDLLAYNLAMSVQDISEIVLENVRRVNAAFNDAYPTVNESLTLPVRYFKG